MIDGTRRKGKREGEKKGRKERGSELERRKGKRGREIAGVCGEFKMVCVWGWGVILF